MRGLVGFHSGSIMALAYIQGACQLLNLLFGSTYRLSVNVTSQSICHFALEKACWWGSAFLPQLLTSAPFWRTASLLSQCSFSFALTVVISLLCNEPASHHPLGIVPSVFCLSVNHSYSLVRNLRDLCARDVVTRQDLVVHIKVRRLHCFENECCLQLCVLKIRVSSLKFACFWTGAKKMRGRKFSEVSKCCNEEAGKEDFFFCL